MKDKVLLIIDVVCMAIGIVVIILGEVNNRSVFVGSGFLLLVVSAISFFRNKSKLKKVDK